MLKRFMVLCLAAVMLGSVSAYAAEKPSVTMGMPIKFEAGNHGTISVTGNGTIKVMPDIATLNIGVTTTGKTTGVQQENAVAMERVIAVMEAAGVDGDDIETAGYSLNPNYDYQMTREDGSHEVVGYSMTHMVRVTVRDIDLVGQVISDAVAAGANVNHGVNFEISDPEKYYNDAMVLAVKNAQSKAAAIAATVGVTLGAPYSVNESGGYSVVMPYAAPYAADIVMAAGGKGAAAPVSAGEMEVSASVSLVYQY